MVATGKWPGNDPMEIPADQAHSPGTFQRLSNYTLSEIERMLATYDKLIVVRHPLERLLSAYRNKLEAKHEKSSRYFQTRFGKKIIRVPFLSYFYSPVSFFLAGPVRIYRRNSAGTLDFYRGTGKTRPRSR